MPIETLEPNPENGCFGCGGANARGLRLAFELDTEQRRVWLRWRPGVEYQGGGGILHGGVTALLFDEAMGKLSRFHDARAVTAELNVRYLKPIPCDRELVVEAWESRREGRSLMQEAVLRDAGGVELARAEGRFVIIGAR